MKTKTEKECGEFHWGETVLLLPDMLYHLFLEATVDLRRRVSNWIYNWDEEINELIVLIGKQKNDHRGQEDMKVLRAREESRQTDNF
jgi:hypothetical protein